MTGIYFNLVAASTAGKAQVCFTETARVMEPYMEEMPNDIEPEFQKVKDLGLLQAQKIYHLIYGWESTTDGVRRTFFAPLCVYTSLMYVVQCQ